MASAWTEEVLVGWVRDGLLGSSWAGRRAWRRPRLTSAGRVSALAVLDALVGRGGPTPRGPFEALDALLRPGGDMDGAGKAGVFHELVRLAVSDPVVETAESVTELVEDEVLVVVLRTLLTLVHAGVEGRALLVC